MKTTIVIEIDPPIPGDFVVFLHEDYATDSVGILLECHENFKHKKMYSVMWISSSIFEVSAFSQSLHSENYIKKIHFEFGD